MAIVATFLCVMKVERIVIVFVITSVKNMIDYSLNPLKTSPEYTRAGVYGKCML